MGACPSAATVRSPVGHQPPVVRRLPTRSVLARLGALQHAVGPRKWALEDELAHRRLMVAYARTGRTSHALRQYLECRRALVEELGVEPSAETSVLQGRILAGEPV